MTHDKQLQVLRLAKTSPEEESRATSFADPRDSSDCLNIIISEKPPSPLRPHSAQLCPAQLRLWKPITLPTSDSDDDNETVQANSEYRLYLPKIKAPLDARTTEKSESPEIYLKELRLEHEILVKELADFSIKTKELAVQIRSLEIEKKEQSQNKEKSHRVHDVEEIKEIEKAISQLQNIRGEIRSIEHAIKRINQKKNEYQKYLSLIENRNNSIKHFSKILHQRIIEQYKIKRIDDKDADALLFALFTDETNPTILLEDDEEEPETSIEDIIQTEEGFMFLITQLTEYEPNQELFITLGQKAIHLTAEPQQNKLLLIVKSSDDTNKLIALTPEEDKGDGVKRYTSKTGIITGINKEKNFVAIYPPQERSIEALLNVYFSKIGKKIEAKLTCKHAISATYQVTKTETGSIICTSPLLNPNCLGNQGRNHFSEDKWIEFLACETAIAFSTGDTDATNQNYLLDNGNTIHIDHGNKLERELGQLKDPRAMSRYWTQGGVREKDEEYPITAEVSDDIKHFIGNVIDQGNTKFLEFNMTEKIAYMQTLINTLIISARLILEEPSPDSNSEFSHLYQIIDATAKERARKVLNFVNNPQLFINSLSGDKLKEEVGSLEIPARLAYTKLTYKKLDSLCNHILDTIKKLSVEDKTRYSSEILHCNTRRTLIRTIQQLQLNIKLKQPNSIIKEIKEFTTKYTVKGIGTGEISDELKEIQEEALKLINITNSKKDTSSQLSLRR